MQDIEISVLSMAKDIESIIIQCRSNVAVHLNVEMNKLYWAIGHYIIDKLGYDNYAEYGKGILKALSHELTLKFGRGYHYSALTRMMKIARVYNDLQMFATLSQTLSWSHFIELTTIDNQAKRHFYQQMTIENRWSLLDEENIKVAQYLTELPDKQWFIDKLNRSVAIANAMKSQNDITK